MQRTDNQTNGAIWRFRKKVVTLQRCSSTGFTSAKSELSAFGLHGPCTRIWETPRSVPLNLVLMFNRTIMYAKLAWVYAKGIYGFRRKVYDLKFVHDDNMWYIDMPWPGDRYNLAMVAGSNHLLTFLDTKKENRVRVLVRPSKKKLTSMNGYLECDKQYSGLLRGATYKVYGLEGFSREIWICPVTLTVLGHYPKYIYIKQMPLA